MLGVGAFLKLFQPFLPQFTHIIQIKILLDADQNMLPFFFLPFKYMFYYYYYYCKRYKPEPCCLDANWKLKCAKNLN